MMTKYSPKQLKVMTSTVINAKNARDPRYHIFLSKLTLASGHGPTECEKRIVEISRQVSNAG